MTTLADLFVPTKVIEAGERMVDHFAMLDSDDDERMVAGRYVLVARTEEGWTGYVTSWDRFEDARQEALPLAEGFRLIDAKTGVYWMHDGIFQ